MDASFTELDSLVTLITSAVNDVKAEYTRLKHPFPTLNDTEPHPLDSQYTPPKLKKAIQAIQGACSQLSTLVTTPQHAVSVVSIFSYYAGRRQLILPCNVGQRSLDVRFKPHWRAYSCL